MRYLKALVICLVLKSCAAVEEQTEICTTSRYELWLEYTFCENVTIANFSTTTDNLETSRLDLLSPIFETLANMEDLPLIASTIFVSCLYDILANVSTISAPVDDEEANLTADFLHRTANIVAYAYTDNNYPSDKESPYPPGLIQFKTDGDMFLMWYLDKLNGPLNFRGRYFFADSFMRVGTMCVVTQETKIAVVVFPPESSPLRPPPIVPEGRVVGYQIVHLILLPDGGFPAIKKQCTREDFFRMIVLYKTAARGLRNYRYGCAQWNDTVRSWTTEFCLPMKEFKLDGAGRCNCDTTFNGETTEYVIFEYVEDVEEFARMETLTLGVKNSSDVEEMNKFAGNIDFVGTKISLTQFDSLLGDILFNVVQFDRSLVANNCSKTILDNIGRIMAAVDPNESSGAVGYCNQLLKSFVFDLDVYKHDPIIAFAFYNSTEHGLDMEYFRYKEPVDLNRLFFGKMEYSFMFAKSVVLENSRYGFILYPLNKFFRLLEVVEGIKVIASRVLDVFLVPRQGHLDTQEQLVHMYLNHDAQSTYEFGCVVWSASLGKWTGEGCFQNHALYRDVCTCNMTSHFNESRTRVTLASLKFSVGIDVYKDFEHNVTVAVDFLIVSVSLFALPNIDRYYPGENSGTIALKVLNTFYKNCYMGGARLDAQTQIEFVQSASRALYNGDNLDILNFHSAIQAPDCLSFRAVAGSTRQPHMDVDHDITCLGDKRLLQTINDTSSFTLRVSNSLKRNNARYAVLTYPLNFNIRPLPAIGRRIIRTFAIDVVLTPKDGGDDDADQFLEATIFDEHFNDTLGCSYWRDDLAAWTEDGCHVVLVNSEPYCNCSVSSNFHRSRTYGQYIVYTSIEAYFDEQGFTKFMSVPIGAGSNADFDLGGELIQNLTMIPLDNDSLYHMLQIYLRLLSFGNALFVKRQEAVALILDDVSFLIGNFDLNIWWTLNLQLRILGTQALQLKNTAVAADLFSNAVLSASDASHASKTLDMTVVVLGFFIAQDAKSVQGFYLYGDTYEEVETIVNAFPEDALLPNSSLACYFTPKHTLERNRVVFTVYPINSSPYPLTMTSYAIFNYRQLDVYVGFDSSFMPSLTGEVTLTVYFATMAATENFGNRTCAAWDDDKQRWSVDVCNLGTTKTMTNVTFDACICDFTNRSVTRIIMYEYTTLENFSFIAKFEGTKIVFLIGALLSVFGLGVLALTAICFPKWREELGNKIMMNLTASALFYLVLSIYRETHLIYAATNTGSVGLIVFTVCVHYSRLAHYCWGLVMSVLQYKRFSGVVGASTISHLLLKVSLFAWGAPLAPLTVLLAWDQKIHFCTPDKMTHYVLYLVPVVVITLLNIVLLVAIVLTITNGCGFWDDDELQRHGVDPKEVMLRRIKQTVLMFFLFGIPAVFEMLNDFGGHVVALEYINKVLDPIQGFVMFLFFVVIDDKTKGYWYAWYYGEEAKVAVQNATKKAPLKLQVHKAKPRRRAQQEVPVVEELPMVELPKKELPVEEQVKKELPVEEQMKKELPVEEQMKKEQPVEEQMKKEQPVEEQATKELSVEEQVKKELPVGEQVKRELSVEEQAKKELPVGEQVKRELSVEEQVKKELSVEEQVKTELPVEEQVKTELPVEEQV